MHNIQTFYGDASQVLFVQQNQKVFDILPNQMCKCCPQKRHTVECFPISITMHFFVFSNAFHQDFRRQENCLKIKAESYLMFVLLISEAKKKPHRKKNRDFFTQTKLSQISGKVRVHHSVYM